ncbi:hypothetical protein GCM10009678_68640 [Actinomadura kijaniata]|uniref:Uncharacterized protein n=1 Tax=Actinomadura namibiensis TaxID=182080 RepID=A0A7W3LYV9_ACTNM|nr:hypothetical protein [Actinomadura namibiensis]MBA8956826.1 hypothetical protein [Actinomadura namibiensis]
MSEISHDETNLSSDQAAVFRAVSRLESGAEGPGGLGRVAAEAGLDEARTRAALEALTGPLGLVAVVENADATEPGPVYRVQTLR